MSQRNTSEARLRGEVGAPAKRVVALPVEGALSQRQNERSEAEGGGSTGFACGGGAEPH